MPIETIKSKPVSAYAWYSQTVKKWLVNTINNVDSLKTNCCDFVLIWIRFFWQLCIGMMEKKLVFGVSRIRCI